MRGMLGGFPLRCCAALVAVGLNALALNLFVGPSADSYPMYAGFAPALGSVAAYAALLGAARRRPGALAGRAVAGAAACAFAAGALLVALGYAGESAPLSLAGWLLASFGTAWVVAMASLSLARQGSAAFAPVLVAFAAVYAAAAFLAPALAAARPARLALLGVYVLTFVAAFACAQGPGRAALAERERGDGFRDGADVRPPSARPRASVLFAVLCALGLACGYTELIVFGTRQSAGVSFVAVAAAVLAVIAASRFARSRTDVVFHFGLLLVLAGLLVMPFVAQTASGERVALAHVSNTLLAAGSACFAMLVWIVLAVRGARRPADALALAAGGRLAFAAGLLGGLVLGASAGSFAAVNPLVPDAVAVALAFVLVAYALVGLRRFSFEESVAGEGVSAADADTDAAGTPAGEAKERTVPRTADPAAALERTCEGLARTGGLTARETEILKMLARGRSAPFIAQELVISTNTVKTHVKHIYAKLGAHSQQEVIDLVDDAFAPE